MNTPCLVTKRIRLYAPYHPHAFDIERQVSWLNDKETMRYSDQRHFAHTVETQQRFVASFDHINRHVWEIAISGIEGDYPIGTVTAYRSDYNKTANVGILIGHKPLWGRGYGFEAWQVVCDWLLANDTRKIEAGTARCNIGMTRIFKKYGMTFEGCRNGGLLLEDGPCDIILVGKFKDELPKSDGVTTLVQQAGHQGDGSGAGPSGTCNRTRIACGA